MPALDFPTAERATLANGVAVTLVRREAVPTVTIALTVNAGSVVDSPVEAGRHELMMNMLTEGTATRGALDILAAQEELGASLSTSAGIDSSQVMLSSLTSNLPQSLDLMADVVLHPAFREEEAMIRTEVLDLLDIFGLADRADLPCRSLSYGDQRRLEIVRALAAREARHTMRRPATTIGGTASE